MKVSSYLECPNCGDAVFGRESNYYTEDEDETCPCGASLSIGVDDAGHGPEAWVRWNDEFKDVGQPKCDGQCEPADWFVGTPCEWTCPRSAQVVGVALVALGGG